jgi:hypothetical protein
MAFFQDILTKLGLKKPVTATPAPVVKPGVPNVRPVGDLLGNLTKAAPVKPAAMEMVDVVEKLTTLAKASKEKLDWKVSIVDLLKLLDIDSSLASRKELAKELGCPSELMGGDYSKMNVWLHKAVLARIAQNGGNVPANLLD